MLSCVTEALELDRKNQQNTWRASKRGSGWRN